MFSLQMQKSRKCDQEMLYQNVSICIQSAFSVGAVLAAGSASLTDPVGEPMICLRNSRGWCTTGTGSVSLRLVLDHKCVPIW